MRRLAGFLNLLHPQFIKRNNLLNKKVTAHYSAFGLFCHFIKAHIIEEFIFIVMAIQIHHGQFDSHRSPLSFGYITFQSVHHYQLSPKPDYGEPYYDNG